MPAHEVELEGHHWMTADVALIRDTRSDSPLASFTYRFPDDNLDPGDVPIQLSDGTLLLAQSYARFDGEGSDWYHLTLVSRERGPGRAPFPDMKVVLADLDLVDAAYYGPGEHPYTGILIDQAPHMPLRKAAGAP